MKPTVPYYNTEVGAGEGRIPRESDVFSVDLVQDIVQSNLVRHLTVLEHIHEANTGARVPHTLLSYIKMLKLRFQALGLGLTF